MNMMLDIAAGVILGNIVSGLFALGIFAFVKDQDGAGAFLLVVALGATALIIGSRFVG